MWVRYFSLGARLFVGVSMDLFSNFASFSFLLKHLNFINGQVIGYF